MTVKELKQQLDEFEDELVILISVEGKMRRAGQLIHDYDFVSEAVLIDDFVVE